MFYRGKHTYKILKDIRRQIAEQNDINLVIEECTYKGDCLGTCPRCESEVRYLEEQLEERRRTGKSFRVAGISAAMISLLAPSCAPIAKKTAPPPNNGEEFELLEGDVAYIPDDLPETDTASSDSEPVTANNATTDQCVVGKIAMPVEPKKEPEETQNDDSVIIPPPLAGIVPIEVPETIPPVKPEIDNTNTEE